MRQGLLYALGLLASFSLLNVDQYMVHVASGVPAQSNRKINVPAGTRILIRTVDAIDSSKQKTGYRFTATLETNLQVDNTVVAPRGTTVYGRLAEASSAGRMKGSSELSLEL